MDPGLVARLEDIESAFAETETSLADPEVHADPAKLAELGQAPCRPQGPGRRDPTMAGRPPRTTVEAEEMADDPEMAQLAEDLAEEIEALEQRIKTALHPDGSQRLQGRDRRDPLRGRWGRGGDLGGRPAPHVRALRRSPRVSHRGHGLFTFRGRRVRQGHGCRQRPGRLLPDEVRGRRASGAASPQDRVAGPGPHLDRHGRRPARGRGDRGRDRSSTT